MPLTDPAIRNAKAGTKPARMFDGGGLYLEVAPSGGKLWRLKYRHGGKEKRLALGQYPAVNLKAARKLRDEARELLARGTDPGEARKAKAAELATLEGVAADWLRTNEEGWTAGYAEKMGARMRRYIFPLLGARPIAEVQAPEILAALRRIEAAGYVVTARRIKQALERIFRYAMAAGLCTWNPAAGLEEVMASRPKKKHFAAITEPAKLGELLRAIHGYSGTPPVMAALKLAPLVFLRPGELRKAEWAELDLDAALWAIPAEKMKMKEPHLVPLSAQAVEILRELHPWTGRGRYVFPSGRTRERPMSENALNAALRCMGYTGDEATPHGFRATARTLLDENLGFRPDLIEHQLAHAVRDPNGRAYNRTSHLKERTAMMQAWADFLDALRTGADVVPIRRKA